MANKMLLNTVHETVVLCEGIRCGRRTENSGPGPAYEPHTVLLLWKQTGIVEDTFEDELEGVWNSGKKACEYGSEYSGSDLSFGEGIL